MSAQIVTALRTRATELRQESKSPHIPAQAAAFKANLAMEFDALATLAEGLSEPKPVSLSQHHHHPLTGQVLQP